MEVKGGGYCVTQAHTPVQSSHLDPSCQSYMFYSPAPIRILLAGPLAPSLSLSALQCVHLVSASYPAPHTLQDMDLSLRPFVLMQVKMLTCKPR